MPSHWHDARNLSVAAPFTLWKAKFRCGYVWGDWKSWVALRVKQVRDELLVMFAAEPVMFRSAGCTVRAYSVAIRD